MRLNLHGTAIGLETLTGLAFSPIAPYAGCKLCGAIFQSAADRNPVAVLEKERRFRSLAEVHDYAIALRREWSRNHAKQHTEKEHLDLAMSGAWCTPDAAYKLAAFGTIPLSDAVMNPEVEHALLESKPIPINDCEGSNAVL